VLVRGHETAAEIRVDGTVLLHVPLPTVEIDLTFLDRVAPSP
jgi:hypothetical protein